MLYEIHPTGPARRLAIMVVPDLLYNTASRVRPKWKISYATAQFAETITITFPRWCLMSLLRTATDEFNVIPKTFIAKNIKRWFCSQTDVKERSHEVTCHAKFQIRPSRWRHLSSITSARELQLRWSVFDDHRWSPARSDANRTIHYLGRVLPR